MNKIKNWIAKLKKPHSSNTGNFERDVNATLSKYHKTLKDLARYDRGEKFSN